MAEDTGETDRSSESGSAFGSKFDVGVPAALVTAVIAFLGAAFNSPLTALGGIGVFLLGLIPQAKMKRADLLVSLQESFSNLASDKDALSNTPATSAGVTPSQATASAATPAEAGDIAAETYDAAYGFYLRFWYLQLLQFGLWRYGMIPSDTYAHWIVRRLISLNETNPERYWNVSPRQGWLRVRKEFIGTDFRHFIDAAIAIGDRENARTQSATPISDPSEEEKRLTRAYNELHLRIERLLVKVSGGGLYSTFVVRWFNARRPPLGHYTTEALAACAERPLERENRKKQNRYLFWALVSIPLAAALGGGAHWLYESLTTKPTKAAFILDTGGTGQTLVLDPDQGPIPTFVVRFEDEGSCQGGSDARRWHGAGLSRSSSAFVARVGKGLAACSGRDRPVKVEVFGFASSSLFRRPSDCGPEIATADAANVALANARAANVADILRRNLTDGNVTIHTWPDLENMDVDRNFVDRILGGTYNRARGSLNRRAEIRVLSAGQCATE
jgi:hypothetical protein